MKILIADNSKTIRLQIGFLLKDIEDAQITEVDSGTDAIKIMTSDDPPQIVLLSWIIKDLNGIEICKQVRQKNYRGDGRSLPPYIILMTSRKNVEDIAQCLNAGADDYIQKPWNDVEFKARFQVARRSALLHVELQRRCAEMESLLMRHELAHNVIIRGNRRTSRVSYTNIDGSEARGASLVSSQDGILSVEKHLVSAFTKIGFGEVYSTLWDGEYPDESPHVAWTASLLDDIGIWLDFLVHISTDSLAYIHEAIGGANDTKSNYSETLKGIVEISQNEVRYALSRQRLDAWTLCSPTILTSHSNKLPKNKEDNAEHVQIQVGDADIFISVSDLETPIIESEIAELKRYQIVAEDVFSPWRNDVIILKRGTILNHSHLNRLNSMSREDQQSLRILVMNASPLGETAVKVSSLADHAY